MVVPRHSPTAFPTLYVRRGEQCQRNAERFDGASGGTGFRRAPDANPMSSDAPALRSQTMNATLSPSTRLGDLSLQTRSPRYAAGVPDRVHAGTVADTQASRLYGRAVVLFRTRAPRSARGMDGALRRRRRTHLLSALTNCRTAGYRDASARPAVERTLQILSREPVNRVIADLAHAGNRRRRAAGSRKGSVAGGRPRLLTGYGDVDAALATVVRRERRGTCDEAVEERR